MVRNLIVLVLVLVLAQSARATVIFNLSTGTDASGNVLTTGGANDANWVINAQPAKAVTSASADWWGFWAANDANSAWIAKDPSSNSANGVGTYSRTFDLTGISLSSVIMSGRWAVDDEGTLSLNGHQIGLYQPHDGWQNWNTETFFSVDNSNNWFNQGTNTLTLNIAASDNFFDAVRLQASLTGAVPEPACLGLLAAGAMGLLLRRRARIAI